jgi:AcrR family transcriptional regulator
MAPTIWEDSLTGHKQRQRAHILRVAADLAAEQGAANVAMSTLARRAGIARATLYNYFPDVERVLAAVVADQAARFRADLDRRLATAPDPAERLHHYLLAVHQWAASRGRSHIDRGRKLSPQLSAVIHEPLAGLRELLASILAEGVARRTFATDIEPRLHAEFIFKLLTEPAAAGSDAGDQLIRFVERGLREPRAR